MAQVLKQAAAKQLGLAGRKSLEIVSGEKGAQAVTLRLVEIPVPQVGEKLRGPHFHNGFEECIYVMSGEGCMEADSGNYPVKAGDTLLVPPGEKHVTRNTGAETLVLLCFFPVAEIARRTQDVAAK